MTVPCAERRVKQGPRPFLIYLNLQKNIQHITPLLFLYVNYFIQLLGIGEEERERGQTTPIYVSSAPPPFSLFKCELFTFHYPDLLSAFPTGGCIVYFVDFHGHEICLASNARRASPAPVFLIPSESCILHLDPLSALVPPTLSFGEDLVPHT